MKTAMIRARTEPALKKEVNEILKNLGLTTTEVINLFFNQIRLKRGLPFEVKLPNEETEKTFNDTDNGKNLIECKDAKDMFNKLGI